MHGDGVGAMMHDFAAWLRQASFYKSGSLGKAHCERGWNWYPAPLADYDFWYALSGEGEMRVNGLSYPIHKGSCFVLRPGDRVHAVQNPDNRLRVIFIHFQCAEPEHGASRHPLFPDTYTSVGETYLFETLLNRLLELEHGRELWKEDEFDLILKQLIMHLSRAQIERAKESGSKERQNNLITRIIAFLKETPGSRMSRQQVADAVQLSPDYISKIFKQSVGVSLREYMTDVRLERAMFLLQETTMNVSQVADALGYANVYLFSRLFKMRYGEPPSRFKLKKLPSVGHGKPD